MPTQRQTFEELLKKHDKTIAEAFLAAVDDLKSGADLSALIEAISNNDIEAAIIALHLTPPALNVLLDAIGAAYTAGGTAAAAFFPPRDPTGAKLVFRFDVRNPRAEQWLTDHSSNLVTNVIEDQKTMIREALTQGLARGDNPTTTALDIVGRIDKATGERSGGIIGLTAPQEQFVASARDELANGRVSNYFKRSLRDKRFDSSIRKAVDAGEPIPADIQTKAVRQYQNRLLKFRGDTVGRTESLTSLRAAKHEAYKQAVDEGTVTAASVRRTWRSAGDNKVRDTHRVLDGETVGLDGPFQSPSGALLMFPGDTSLGADASEIINCRCDVEYRIDFLANVA
jgi:hypothetical protein